MELTNAELFKRIASLEAELAKVTEQKANEEKSLQEKYSKERDEITQNLQKEKKEMEESLTQKISTLQEKLEHEVKDIENNIQSQNKKVIDSLTKENESLRESLNKEKNEASKHLEVEKTRLVNEKDTEINELREQVEGLNKVLEGYQKQINQIEENNTALHLKMADVQNERDSFKNSTEHLKAKEIEYEIKLHKMEEASKCNKVEIDDLKERHTSSLRLQEESFEETTYLKENVKNTKETEKILQSDISYMKQNISSLNHDLRNTREKLSIAAQEGSELPGLKNRITALITDLENTNKQKRSLEENQSKLSEESIATKNSLTKCQTDMKEKEDTLSHHMTVLDELRLLCSSSEENSTNIDIGSIGVILKNKLEVLKSKLIEKETENDILTKSLEEEKNKSKSNEERLKSKEEEIREINDKISNLSDEHVNKIEEIKKGNEKELLDKEASLESQWNIRSEDMVQVTERQLQSRLDSLVEEWNEEKIELERLIEMASSAFKSGTESVDLLKKQVTAQKQELQEMKNEHRKEISELNALLQLKKRSKHGRENIGQRDVMNVESMELKYLQNILYRYITGKDSESMLKILCDLVKFSKEQKLEILKEKQTDMT